MSARDGTACGLPSVTREKALRRLWAKTRFVTRAKQKRARPKGIQKAPTPAPEYLLQKRARESDVLLRCDTHRRARSGFRSAVTRPARILRDTEDCTLSPFAATHARQPLSRAPDVVGPT